MQLFLRKLYFLFNIDILLLFFYSLFSRTILLAAKIPTIIIQLFAVHIFTLVPFTIMMNPDLNKN